MRKTLITKLFTLLMALVVMLSAVPNVTAQAAVKPGAVSKVKITKVTKNSAKVTYKKAKKAKGYQIRVYQGKKQILSKKTKALSYNLKKLKANVKYTVKVRAYNGKKYGKEKTITFKTKKNTTKNPTSTPTEPTEEDTEESNQPAPQPVLPGTSTSEGDKLVAEYNAYVAYIAADWGNASNTATANQDSSVTCLNVEWLKYTGGMFNSWSYSDAYTDKYQAFKHGCGTLDAITDYYADVLTGCGLTVTYQDVTNDYNRYNMLYAYNNNFKQYYDNRIHKGLIVTTQDGKTTLTVIGFAPSSNGLILNRKDTTELEDGRTIICTCPGCGNELRSHRPLTKWQTMAEEVAEDSQKLIDMNSCNTVYCETCKKRVPYKTPYTVDNLKESIYIRTAEVLSYEEAASNGWASEQLEHYIYR